MAFGVLCEHCGNKEEYHEYLKENNYKKLEGVSGQKINSLRKCPGYQPDNPMWEMKIYAENILIGKNSRIENAIQNISDFDKINLESITKKSLKEIIQSFKNRETTFY